MKLVLMLPSLIIIEWSQFSIFLWSYLDRNCSKWTSCVYIRYIT